MEKEAAEPRTIFEGVEGRSVPLGDTSFMIVLTDNPWVSPDPGGRYYTMGQAGKRIREDLDRREKFSLKKNR